MHAVGGVHRLLHLPDQFLHVGAGSAAHVDDKACVLGGNLRSAYRQALQARLFDECPGEVALRPLEGAARRGQVERLGGAALFHELPHPGADILRLRGRELQRRRGDERPRALKRAVAVAELKLLRGDLAHRAVRQRELGALEHVFHLAPVGARVHEHGPAERAGYAVGKLQAREPGVGREHGELRERDARPGPDAVPGQQPGLGYGLAQPHDNGVQPPVRDEEVRALAHELHGRAALPQKAQQRRGLRARGRAGHEPRRAAYAEGAVRGHVMQGRKDKRAVYLSETLANMSEGFFIYRAVGEEKLLYANPGAIRLFGCETIEEFREQVHNSFRGMVHPQDLARVEWEIHDQIKQSDRSMDYIKYRIVRKDGTVASPSFFWFISC